MNKFSHEKILTVTINVVYITSMLYVFGFTILTVVENM